jgi:hypothetical protein
VIGRAPPAIYRRRRASCMTRLILAVGAGLISMAGVP